MSAPDANPAIVFSIATVPDVAGLRLVHGLPTALADNEVVEFAYQKGRAQADVSDARDILPPHLHRVVSIACALQDDQQCQVFSLAAEDDGEAALIQRFFDLITQQRAGIVSWNCAAFDLPVLQCRALAHGVSGMLLDCGVQDLSQLLAGPSGKQVSMHELAGLCGFPGTPRLSVKQFWNVWRNGQAAEIHAHCETDAATSHLVFLRFQQMCGLLDTKQYVERVAVVRQTLTALDAQPWREFLAEWV